jgi:hypothetical protein
VIAILGLKLVMSLYEHFYPEAGLSKFLGSHAADWITSGLTVGVFLIPILTSVLFNYPKRGVVEEKKD